MDLLSPDSTTKSPLIPVFGDNVQDLLGRSALKVNPSAIITVNSIADTVDDNDGVTTLREAINQANADAGEDLIVFERSVFSNPQTITLSGTELDITHNLHIIAPRDPLTGEDLVTVSGNKTSRVFEIESGATASLDGLIVTDGQVKGNDGGGGIKNSGTLTLDNSTISGNRASEGYDALMTSKKAAYGGGIYNTGTLTVNTSTLSGNTASINLVNNGGSDVISVYGGGIYNTGTLTVSASTLSGNTGDFTVSIRTIFNIFSLYINVPEHAGYGGGIYNAGNLTVSASTLSDNKASGSAYAEGGSIYNAGNLTVSASTLSGNTASGGASGEGGGIYNAGDLTVSASALSGNTASGYVGASSSNTTGGYTGGYGYGGGIYNAGDLTVSASTLSDNKANGGYSGYGGGIYSISTGNLTVSASTLSGNSASSGLAPVGAGGGIYGNGNITDCTISGNKADIGGGISGGGNITNCTISGNSGYRFGGGINGGGKITNCTISGNEADTGGGINGGGKITNCTISGNKARSMGGGIYNTGTVTLLFSTVTQNQAPSGGGVYGFNVIIRNTIIASNLPTANGINPDVSGTFTSYGYNLIGDSTGSTGFSEGLADIVGTSDRPIDPRLAPLDFYGGSTQTFALRPDSPAIDADPTVLLSDPTTDQRGFPRVVNGRADLGAFEFSS